MQAEGGGGSGADAGEGARAEEWGVGGVGGADGKGAMEVSSWRSRDAKHLQGVHEGATGRVREGGEQQNKLKVWGGWGRARKKSENIRRAVVQLQPTCYTNVHILVPSPGPGYKHVHVHVTCRL